MNYKVSRKKATIAAADFVKRYLDVERMAGLCGQCPSFGKSWACPPHEFDTASVTDGFVTVTLMATVIEFDERTLVDCRASSMARRVADRAMNEVLEKLLPEMYEMELQVPGSRCFTFRCRLCSEGCTRSQRLACRHPDRLRYSLEAVGFDVTAATRDLLGIDLEWSEDGSLPRHITLVTALMSPE